LHNDALEDLLVGGIDKGFKDEHDGDNIFLLSPRESEHGATVGEVVKGVGDSGLIWTYATNLDGILGVGRAAVGEGGSEEGDDMISAGQNEVAN
jgi:hypothetical protein